MSNLILNNGLSVPELGFGTADHKESEFADCIFKAITYGYRFIDTAYAYGTESLVGEAVKRAADAGIDRKDLFIQTKFYPPQRPYGGEDVVMQFEESLQNLNLDYIDSYLIHQPVPRNSELTYCKQNISVWKAMEELYRQGYVRAIGVSNFLERHILQLEDNCDIRPMINQLEINPFFQERGLADWCRKRGMLVQAWGPLAQGEAMEQKQLLSIASKHHVTVAQVCLRWNQQMGNIPICLSINMDRMRQNLDLGFDLNDEDMEVIRLLNSSTGHRKTYWYPRQQMY